jgi:hypothetical protein
MPPTADPALSISTLIKITNPSNHPVWVKVISSFAARSRYLPSVDIRPPLLGKHQTSDRNFEALDLINDLFDRHLSGGRCLLKVWLVLLTREQNWVFDDGLRAVIEPLLPPR